MKARKNRMNVSCLVVAVVLGRAVQAQAWTTPVPTTPETEAAIERFAEMSPKRTRQGARSERNQVWILEPSLEGSIILA
jgi:hypothetical protein